MRAPAAAISPGNVALRLAGVTKRYGGTTALDDVSLEVRAGEFLVLLGASGAGKSTVFRCVTGLVQPDEGEIDVLGTSVVGLSRRDLRRLRRSIGLVFQQFNLIGRLDAMKNVLAGRLGHAPFWRVVLRAFSTADRQRALGSLDAVGLLERAYQRADSLSGGQQQRVAIARALTQEARLILADEPVSSLDPEASDIVLSLLRTLGHERGIAVVCSLHQVELARRFADRVVGLRDGRVVFEGAPDALDDAALDLIYRGGEPIQRPGRTEPAAARELV